MKTIHEIERVVSNLPPEDLSRFRAWLFEFDAQVWDERFESDVAAGRLQALADEARADLRAGRTARSASAMEMMSPGSGSETTMSMNA